MRVCQAHHLDIDVDSIIPLLANSYTAAQLEALVSNIKSVDGKAT